MTSRDASPAARRSTSVSGRRVLRVYFLIQLPQSHLPSVFLPHPTPASPQPQPWGQPQKTLLNLQDQLWMWLHPSVRLRSRDPPRPPRDQDVGTMQATWMWAELSPETAPKVSISGLETSEKAKGLLHVILSTALSKALSNSFGPLSYLRDFKNDLRYKVASAHLPGLLSPSE